MHFCIFILCHNSEGGTEVSVNYCHSCMSIYVRNVIKFTLVSVVGDSVKGGEFQHPSKCRCRNKSW